MEGFSNSMLEAMACGLPIVTTPIGAGAEVIKEEIGVVVATKNSTWLAGGIGKEDLSRFSFQSIRDANR